MATSSHFDVEIKDNGKARTVRVILTLPDHANFHDLQEIAQRAWDSPDKKAMMGGAVARIVRPK